MKKNANWWDDLRGSGENAGWGSTLGNLAVDLTPVVGTVASAGDMINNLGKGNYWSAAGNLGMGLVSLIPGGGALKFIGKGGQRAIGGLARAVNTIPGASKAVGRTAKMMGATRASNNLIRAGTAMENVGHMALPGSRSWGGLLGYGVASGTIPLADEFRHQGAGAPATTEEPQHLANITSGTPALPNYYAPPGQGGNTPHVAPLGSQPPFGFQNLQSRIFGSSQPGPSNSMPLTPSASSRKGNDVTDNLLAKMASRYKKANNLLNAAAYQAPSIAGDIKPGGVSNWQDAGRGGVDKGMGLVHSLLGKHHAVHRALTGQKQWAHPMPGLVSGAPNSGHTGPMLQPSTVPHMKTAFLDELKSHWDGLAPQHKGMAIGGGALAAGALLNQIRQGDNPSTIPNLIAGLGGLGTAAYGLSGGGDFNGAYQRVMGRHGHPPSTANSLANGPLSKYLKGGQPDVQKLMGTSDDVLKKDFAGMPSAERHKLRKQVQEFKPSMMQSMGARAMGIDIPGQQARFTNLLA